MNPSILTRENGAAIAYHHSPGLSSPAGHPPTDGHPPGILFCGGFKSDMTGIKATTLQSFCDAREQQYTRFDYQGHGASSGEFAAGIIGEWRRDMLAIFDAVASGPQIVVGSSMGGWMALLLALARPERVKGLVLIAPAADFTEALLRPNLSDSAKHQIETEGVWMRPSIYNDGPYPITKALLDDAKAYQVLNDPIPFDGPVRVFHGGADETIPFEHVLRTVAAITSQDIVVSWSKAGDHRLSSPADLDRLCAAIADLSDALSTPKSAV
ncbi:MAG: alpha/beta hydrolase [Alphaproteobacteria bacterium]|nr:alpha/beta hydrolase [Alphaproteobacteria bacterium]